MVKKKASKKPKSKDVKADEKPTQIIEPEKGEKFDFGGLPDRNLKKNLGCG